VGPLTNVRGKAGTGVPVGHDVIKFIVVLVRRSGWDHARFEEYFLAVHEPLAVRIPGLRRYVQNFWRPDPNRDPPAWDAVVELWFDDYEATADLEKFTDLKASSWSVVHERVVKPSPELT